MRGEPSKYRVVMAAEGRCTTDFMEAWSTMLHSEESWLTVPDEVQTHELSIQGFRGLSAALYSKHELQCVILEEQCPVAGYAILSTQAAGADIIAAEKLINWYNHDPCVLCFRWFDHCRKYPTVAKMLSPDSKAEIIFHADEADLDNIDVETGNTKIHRSVRRGLQQKLASLSDVAAQFIISSDKATHTSLISCSSRTRTWSRRCVAEAAASQELLSATTPRQF